jgi:hypothetical protein
MIMNSKFRFSSKEAALFTLFALSTACGDSEEGAASGDRSGSGGAGASSAGAGTGGAGTGGARAAASGGRSTGGTSTGGRSGSGGRANGGTSDGGDPGSAGQTALDGGDSGTAGETGVPTVEEVDLGAAENYAILAKSGISTVPTSAVEGDIGVSPVAATAITGFSLTADASDEFSISPQVTGTVYAADYASPTPAELTAAVSDMELAFTDAAGRAPTATELGAGDIGGMTLAPGVYRWGKGLLIPTDLTLSGDASAVWIFQIAQDLTVANATSVVLAGGALPEHVFWQVSGQVELGTTAHFEGVILTQTSITLGTGASINGRLLAQTAVVLDANRIVEPTP